MTTIFSPLSGSGREGLGVGVVIIPFASSSGETEGERGKPPCKFSSTLVTSHWKEGGGGGGGVGGGGVVES